MFDDEDDPDDNFEELTVHWVENGKEKIKELDRAVLHKGSGWATLAFLFEELDEVSGEYKGPKVNLRRYRKRGGRWQVNGHFVLNSEEQAVSLQKALQGWFKGRSPRRRPPRG